MELTIAGRITFERAEQRVAELLVEWSRLILEGIEIHTDAAARPAMFLRRLHQRRSRPGAAVRVVDPQLRDIEPAPADVTEQASHDRSMHVAQEDVDRL